MATAALLGLQLAAGVSVGFTAPVTAAAASGSGSGGRPNRFDPRGITTSVNHLPPPPKAASGPPPRYGAPHPAPVVPMKPGLVALDPVAGAHFMGSDGLLELSVPSGAVTAADLAAAGGRLSLLVRQVAPPSGSNAGGSGRYTFGTWLVQVVDAAGRPASRGLRQQLMATLHVTGRASALDLAHVRVAVNPPLPWWVNLDPGSVSVTPASAARQAPSSPRPTALGPPSRQSASLDAAGSTLSASVPASGSSTAVSFDTDAPVATFGRPDPFETDLSAGALSAGIKLALPAGPGGLTPPLTLAYNSSALTDQHNPQGAATWVGEGWNLGLGSISWAEHNVETVNPNSTPLWEDSWQLSDPFGTAADLVPPNINVATYTEDSGNPITPSPVTWHTAPETRAKVISFSSGIVLPNSSPVPPCFRVFLVSGIMEEFGCTPDSLLWYPQATGSPNAGKPFIASWLLDLITDPAGNQVHVIYQQDVATAPTGLQYTRDAVPATVEYDSPSCHNAQAACTGSAWAPLMRVSLEATHTVAHQEGVTCSTGGSPRCDDPLDLTGSSGVAAPLIQSTFVLNDAAVQVRASAGSTWSTLRDYRFNYEQTGPTTIPDPESGASQSTAGRLLLLRMQVVGADGATVLPPREFGYAPLTQYYEDSLGAPKPSNNCGPSWNNGITPNGHNTCVLWSQSYAGNSYYLSAVNNGLGLQETFTWQLARNNFHGVVSGSAADPLACDNASVQPTFPCNMPDDETWSRAVLAKREDVTNGVDSVWNYSYQVRTPLPAPECALCVATFYWGNQNDFDLLDFYNSRFMGFAVTNVSRPDGSLEVHKFHTTEGFGLYDPSQVSCDPIDSNHTCTPHADAWSDLDNAAHGHEYELDQYDTNGTTLLKQVRTQWQAVCPPADVSGTPANPTYGNWDGNLVTELDHSNPVMVCDVQRQQTDSFTYDGTGGLPVHSATSYTYDSMGRVADQAQLANATAVDSSGHGSHATLTGGVTLPVGGLVPGNSDTALGFDGSTGFLQLPNAPFGAYPPNGSSTTSYALTFEAWFKTTTGGVILGQVSGSALPPTIPFDGGWIPALYVDTTGALDERLFWHGSGPLTTASGPYNDGQPHHVVVTYASGIDSLYVDGQLKASQSSVSEVGYSIAGYSYYLGNGYAGTYPNIPSGAGWYPFQGTIGEAAVYPTALSAARVQAHFSAGSSYQAAVAADSPAAYWRLNDEAGTTSPNTIVSKPQYVQDDGVTATSTSATGRYLIDYPAFDDVEDPSGNRYQCSYNSYDGQGFQMGQFSGLTVGKVTTADRYTGCGTSGNGFFPSGQIRTTSAYDVFGNLVGRSDPDANAGVGGHTGCTVGSTSYSTCTTFDGTFGSLPTASANALNQTTTTGYQSPSATTPSAVQDASGHGDNATPGTAVTLGAAGLVSGDPDTAMSFNGTSASTVNLDMPGVDTASGDQVTVELWMRWPGGTSGGMPFGFNRYDLWMNPTPSAGFGFNTAAGDVFGVPASAIPANAPVHVVAVFTNGSVTSNKLYINGVAQSLTQRQGTPTSQTATQFANISGWGRDTGNRWTGSVGKVAIYNGALSATRVQAHFSAGSGYNAAVLADSPIAYYRLNDTTAQGGLGLWPTSRADANGKTTSVTYDALGRQTSQTQPVTMIADSSGHGRSGIPNGSLTYGAAGMTYGGDADNAMSFSGGTVNLNLPTLDTTAGHQVTVEFWMQYSGGAGMPFGFNQYDLWLDSGSGFGFNTAVGDNYGVPLSAVPTNAPLHVVAVFTNGSVTSNALYINGVAQTLAQLRTGTPAARSVTANANIAGWGQDGNNRFPGTIDEVALYNGALPAARVQAHFNAGVSYKSAVLADSPLAYYRLDEDNRPATQTTSYTVWCTGAGPQTPCIEVDHTQRLNGGTTATSRAFYDGLGHLVETRSPAPGSQDVIQASVYDVSGRRAFQTVPYLVAAYTGPPGAAAYSTPDLTKGTQWAYDGLGRLLKTTNALGFVTTGTYGVVCPAAGVAPDSACYEQTLTVDPNLHLSGTLVDGLGRIAYVQRYTGSSSSTYALYATARYTYDFAGDLVRIVQPDGSTTTTFGYDMAGRKTSMTDPDLGPQTYTYDQDGNLTQSVDARGGAGTIFMGYDGLDRPTVRSTNSDLSSPYDTYSYDATAGGSAGVGRLTSETFATGALSGSSAFTYDGRGRQTGSTLTVGASSYPLASTYDEAGDLLTQTYPDGETITNSYTSQGWLSGMTTTLGNTTLASNLTYGVNGGAFGEITSMQIGSTYTYNATYDLLDRATDLKWTKTAGGAVMFDQSRAFDNAGNVKSIATNMGLGATDNQSFCYDEQDRLTWASSATATAPAGCGNNNTAGTLNETPYTQAFSYDAMGRLTIGPLGTYTYGSSAHVHAATAVGGTAWTAAYDAAGNMTCRAPSSSSTCAGTPTGAQLGYNNEGELQSWQNTPSSPSTTAQFLYDGQGQRVVQSMTQSGTTTTTVYVGDLEEVSTTGGTTTTTAYYYAAGKRIGLSVNGAISYLASDGLGSTTVTLSSGGAATAAQLFAPYGGVRYSSGTVPTPYGFTGQRSDAVSGLDYYGARYYDPLAGQFTSGDSVVPGGGLDLWGLSRYAYVGGNPVLRVDPSGHDGFDPGGGGACGQDDPACGPPPDPTPPPDQGPGDANGGSTLPCGCPGQTGDEPPPYQPPPAPVSGPPPGNGPPPDTSPLPNGDPALTACDLPSQCSSGPPPIAMGTCQLVHGCNQQPEMGAIAILGQRAEISSQGGCFAVRLGDRGGSCSVPPPTSGEDPFIYEWNPIEGGRLIWVGRPDSGKKPGGRGQRPLGPAFQCMQSTACRLAVAAVFLALVTIFFTRPWQDIHENPQRKPEMPNGEVPDRPLYAPTSSPPR